MTDAVRDARANSGLRANPQYRAGCPRDGLISDGRRGIALCEHQTHVAERYDHMAVTGQFALSLPRTPTHALQSMILYNILHSQMSASISHQLAFFTPGMLPARAFKRNWNCTRCSVCMPPAFKIRKQLTLAMRKSLSTPLPFAPMIQRFLICVGRV